MVSSKGIPSQEKIICFFQFLMSGLELHANSVMGRYISLLTKAFMSLKSEQTSQMQATRSYAALEKERTKAPRSLRKKGVSASTLTSLEHSLAKQSQLVNKLRYCWSLVEYEYIIQTVGSLVKLISCNLKSISYRS